MNKATDHQPPPEAGAEDVADYVLADIQARVEAGLERYGTKLQTFNGRDPLWDAYQEAIDLVMYLRQAILERDKARVIWNHRADDWISVDKALPESDQTVLVVWNGSIPDVFTRKGSLWVNRDGLEVTTDEFTHWAPITLPAAD